jgi:hypothetical protein
MCKATIGGMTQKISVCNLGEFMLEMKAWDIFIQRRGMSRIQKKSGGRFLNGRRISCFETEGIKHVGVRHVKSATLVRLDKDCNSVAAFSFHDNLVLLSCVKIISSSASNSIGQYGTSSIRWNYILLLFNGVAIVKNTNYALGTVL